jgi:hypothetical protein
MGRTTMEIIDWSEESVRIVFRNRIDSDCHCFRTTAKNLMDVQEFQRVLTLRNQHYSQYFTLMLRKRTGRSVITVAQVPPKVDGICVAQCLKDDVFSSSTYSLSDDLAESSESRFATKNSIYFGESLTNRISSGRKDLSISFRDQPVIVPK